MFLRARIKSYYERLKTQKQDKPLTARNKTMKPGGGKEADKPVFRRM